MAKRQICRVLGNLTTVVKGCDTSLSLGSGAAAERMGWLWTSLDVATFSRLSTNSAGRVSVVAVHLT